MINDYILAVLGRFFRTVSFERDERPDYGALRELFVADGRLVNTTGATPEVLTVDEFIASRQATVDSGVLAWFEEVELDGETSAFGNVAHRFSRYAKVGERDGTEFRGNGMISTQFIRTPDGWRITVMAWDDERPGQP